MGQDYKQDLRSAARRYLEAGETLVATSRKDIAGYLFGIAAECALKHIMANSGMRPLPNNERWNDPFYAHFEELKGMLRERAYGRLATDIRRYAESSSFMQHWDVSMRYSDGKSVKTDWVLRWQRDAKTIVGAMDC